MEGAVGNLDSVERSYIRERWEASFSEALLDQDDEGEEEFVQSAVADVMAWRKANSRKAHTDRGRPIPDDRWDLLRDLRGAIDPEIRRWDRLEIKRTANWGNVVYDLGDQRVTVEFDSRLALESVCRALANEWPMLSALGVVRRTRPLGSRSIALLRHVCLGTRVGDRWRYRLVSWNKRYPKWEYKNASRFNTAFHRAEEQLTGSRGGLRVFYDIDERTAADNAPEVLKLLSRENFAAVRRNLGMESFGATGPITLEEIKIEKDLKIDAYQGIPDWGDLALVAMFVETHGESPLSEWVD